MGLGSKIAKAAARWLGVDDILRGVSTRTVERSLWLVRNEYTVMPRFGFHQPLDYYLDTPPVHFDPPLSIAGEELPVPAPDDRMGYCADDVGEYLAWGRSDKELVQTQIRKHLGAADNLAILDFGCSSGRVLRHFYPEAKEKGWTLHGVDVQARPIQWMREFLPATFCIYTGSTMPMLPFPDNHFDVIYGFSIFTHIKYHWDMWLLELKRVLKPGGLLIQTIHTEHAWQRYYESRNEDWVRKNHSAKMLETREMPHDYFLYGDIGVSQAFWKRDVARAYWGRYFEVLDVLPPPDARSFQDWMVCRKAAR
jgi:SAM-dependent methyltransferase